MSSTTDHSRGQALAVFTLSLTAIVLAAALAFDVGQVLLERRDQQNAADAAAMAGARYILSSDTQAEQTARDLATDNGFTHGDASQAVYVNIPPTDPGPWVNFEGALEVKICNTRPSFFASLAGIVDWDVCARAVAAQIDGVGGPFAILALAEHECEALKVQGNQGTLEAYGSIQVNSDCPSSALKAGGTGIVKVDSDSACRIHGGIQVNSNATLTCGETVNPAPIEKDPLLSLIEPTDTPPRAAVARAPVPAQVPVLGETTKSAPSGCSATVNSPAVCQFNASYKDTTWRLSPGLYPGGLKLQAGVFYLEPGVYVLGGGGLSITGNGTHTYSVDPGKTPTLVAGAQPTCAERRIQGEDGGVLLFNTQLGHIDRADAGAFGPISLNGSDANICLQPLGTDPHFENIVIYQDRHYSVDGDDIWINGDDSDGMDVRGTVYAPNGDVKVNGNEGGVTLDQVIAWTFFASGNGGKILALDENDNVYQFNAAGLVE